MNSKFRKNKKNAGMTYVELIVVLSIFSIITGSVFFNYKQFQSKVDLKNLANDIALKFVEAQKNATSGEIPFGKIIPTSPPLPEEWKPSYGLYFDGAQTVNTGTQTFYYFTDLDQNKMFDQSYGCLLGECIERFRLTKTNTWGEMYVHFYTGNPESVETGISATFTRPDSAMTLRKSTGEILENVDYLEFQLAELSGTFITIRIYSSGRIEML